MKLIRILVGGIVYWKSSKSGGNDGGDCVLVSPNEGPQGGYFIRNSRFPANHMMIWVTKKQWETLLTRIKGDQKAGYLWDKLASNKGLDFTASEWDAFTTGIKAGEFDQL